MIEISLGQRIHELRDKADLSLRGLAKRIGISSPFLSDIELGRRFPSEEILAKLAGALNVPLEDLKQYDTRAPIADLKRLMDSDPKLGFAFRTAVEKVKSGQCRLMGFGHRVYKNYDPRARIIKRIADEVFEVTGRNRKLDIALELERIALSDEYFIKRRLYPNVDFYSGIIYQAMGFTPDMFTVLFAIPRTIGWLSQWQELLKDSEQKIARPRQIYTGAAARDLVKIADRVAANAAVTVG